MQPEPERESTTNCELMALMAPSSSTEHSHSGELDRHNQPPLAGVVKRKRTKRPRHQLPASSSESTTTEEEDMAHCLILLAQGSGGGAAVDSKPSSPPAPAVVLQQETHHHHQPSPPVVAVKSSTTSERYTSRKYTEAATTADGVKAGFYVYECRTCNKCFPTFQALGGHRASHKKPRLLLAISTTSTAAGDDEIKPPPPMMMMMTPPPPLPSPAPAVDVTTALSLNSHVPASAGTGSSNCGKAAAARVHECSICGAEFASGQALGGHMRRHRPLNAPPAAITKKFMEGGTSINLELDLNLPAPSEEVVLGLGQFNDGNKAAGGLMLTASALVDCHY